jgi:transcriptional regulator with XRE-family HTH domain
MAAELGMSPSYLNHLERNQRPITAQVLLRLARSYEVDLKSFTAEGEGTGTEDLAEIFADPMFSDIGIPRYELLEVADNAPSVADAISRLYTALVERRQAPAGAEREGEASLVTPENWVRDYIQSQRNYFSYIEEAAETLAGALGDRPGIFAALARRLKEAFGVDTRIVPPELLEAASQHYDHHRKRLKLSEMLRP